MITEAAEQLPCRPDVVVASVGGGGLLNGVLHGMWNVGWNDVPVVAMETEGADCFNASLKVGKLVTLPVISRYDSRLSMNNSLKQDTHGECMLRGTLKTTHLDVKKATRIPPNHSQKGLLN